MKGMIIQMKKALILRLAPIYILTAALFSAVCAGVSAVLISGGVKTDVLIWFVPLMMALCVAWSVSCTVIVRKIRKQFSDSFDQILSSFVKEDAEALMSINGGDPLPEQLARWVKEQSELFDEARRNNVAIASEVELSGEIFWRISDKGCSFRYGEYWSKNYGYVTLNSSGDIRSHIQPSDLPEFERALKNTQDRVINSFNIVVGLIVSPHKTVTARVRGSGIDGIGSDEQRMVVGIIHDIDAESELERRLESEQIKNRFLLQSAKDVIYEVDVPENKLVSLNPEMAEELFGLGSMNDFDGERRPYWENIHLDYREGFVDRFFDYTHMMIMPEHMMTYEYRIRNKAGDYIWVEHTAQVISHSGNKVEKVIGRISNINELKGIALDLHFKSMCDGLTGALLKSALGGQYDDELKKGRKQAVVLFNINRFRFINNQYGYEFGDMVLRRVTELLWTHQKGKCIIGRADDDTFIIAMLAVTEKDHPESQFVKLLPVFSEPIKINNTYINITFSAASSIPSSETRFNEAFCQAEKALAVCKSLNQVYKNSHLPYSAETEDKFTELSAEKTDEEKQDTAIKS